MALWRHTAAVLLLCTWLCLVIGQETSSFGEEVQNSADDDKLGAESLSEVLEATNINIDDDGDLLQTPGEPTVEVEDYLATLSTDELTSICVDRGFDIIPRQDGKPLEWSDYLEAARRCLSLEDEMNAILAKNPELAAELEAEIGRMQQHKHRLEGEREQLLAEKALLEEQLEKAGVDLLEAQQSAFGETATASLKDKSPEDMTFKEVLIYTFSELYDRVKRDFKFVWKFAGPVLKPVGGALQLGWRHLRPHAEMARQEVTKRAQQIFHSAKAKVEEQLNKNAVADEEDGFM
eukprot:CAMPEP_0168743778 /NCGR_PEP_ID=MMETSP0724-20121128/13753_1 /TAXON_ID=265536 /ORGANISM="Amphiprora sp., Strain CCMP467" /LENGTH=291 /DNA_ID=CAMNT_0008791421 /DNA_START=63 /DNA_END=938 /DNA_ORIENTATION=+